MQSGGMQGLCEQGLRIPVLPRALHDASKGIVEGAPLRLKLVVFLLPQALPPLVFVSHQGQLDGIPPEPLPGAEVKDELDRIRAEREVGLQGALHGETLTDGVDDLRGVVKHQGELVQHVHLPRLAALPG